MRLHWLHMIEKRVLWDVCVEEFAPGEFHASLTMRVAGGRLARPCTKIWRAGHGESKLEALKHLVEQLLERPVPDKAVVEDHE